MKIKIPNLFLALAWLALPTLVSAQFSFTTNNGIITITGYNTAAGLNVVIPAATNGFPVTSIGADAFEFKSITNVTIPNSVTSIGEDAFGYCDGLTNATIPNSVTTIGGGAFSYCATLTNITVAAANPAYSSLGGVLFDKAKATLIQFPAGLGGGYVITNSVTVITNSAFYNCYLLTSVVIPNSVTTIGNDAFSGCTSLTSVTIGNGLTNIADFLYGNFAFAGCSSLSSAYFLGNAPPNDGTVFSSPAIVYYLAGTIGWGPTFGGVPAMLWNPQPNASNFTGGHFGFNLTGPANTVVVVEACTNLSHAVWLPIATNTIPDNSTSAFSDLQSGAHPTRFYRERSP